MLSAAHVIADVTMRRVQMLSQFAVQKWLEWLLVVLVCRSHTVAYDSLLSLKAEPREPEGYEPG